MRAAAVGSGGELDGLYPARQWPRARAPAATRRWCRGLVVSVSLTPIALDGRIEDEPGRVHGVVAAAVSGCWLASWRWLDRRTPGQRLGRLRRLRTEAGGRATAARRYATSTRSCRRAGRRWPRGSRWGWRCRGEDEEPRLLDRLIGTWVVWELEAGMRESAALSSGG